MLILGFPQAADQFQLQERERIDIRVAAFDRPAQDRIVLEQSRSDWSPPKHC